MVSSNMCLKKIAASALEGRGGKKTKETIVQEERDEREGGCDVDCGSLKKEKKGIDWRLHPLRGTKRGTTPSRKKRYVFRGSGGGGWHFPVRTQRFEKGSTWEALKYYPLHRGRGLFLCLAKKGRVLYQRQDFTPTGEQKVKLHGPDKREPASTLAKGKKKGIFVGNHQ